jgi:hypothetical protein
MGGDVRHRTRPVTCPGCWAFDFCELDEVGALRADELGKRRPPTWEPYHQSDLCRRNA